MSTPDDLLPSAEESRQIARINRLMRRGSSPEAEFAARWSSQGGDYCVYCLAEAGKRVRYIGITNQRIDKRLAQHLADCGRGKNIYKENWLRSCAERNVEVTIHVVRSGLTATKAGMIEELLIRLLKRPFKLTNTHAGGATGYAGLSEESRAKHKINTKKGAMRALEKELEAFDMERGYCLLDEWGDEVDQTENDEPEALLVLHPERLRSPNALPHLQAAAEIGGSGLSWERDLIETIRARKYAWRTEQSYRAWAAQFADFLTPRSPFDANREDVEDFMTMLVIKKRASLSTQRQALNALTLLMADALRRDLGEFEFSNTKRTPSGRTLKVLSNEECTRLFSTMQDMARLMAELIYSAGLRLQELQRLRVHHIDVERRRLRIDGINSDRDRFAVLPKRLIPTLLEHIDRLGVLWRMDQEECLAGVWLPSGIEKKDPKAGISWEWQWMFPARTTFLDPTSGVRRRHHISDSIVQRSLDAATAQAGLSTHVTSLVLRHSFAVHLLDHGVDIRTLQELGFTNPEIFVIYSQKLGN